jgi:hypothetical protein
MLLYVFCAALYSTLIQAADFFENAVRVSTIPNQVVAPSFEDADLRLDRLYDEIVPEPDAAELSMPVPESRSSKYSCVAAAWQFFCEILYVSVQERFAVTALLCLLYRALLCTVCCILYCDAV